MLKQIKTKILSLISSRGFKRSLFFGGVVFMIFHFGFDTVFATETGPAGTTGDSADAINSILGFIQIIVGMAATLLGALTGLISILLDPGFTNGTAFNISGHIKQVWIFMSNMVYLIFAGILIMISFANIVGKGEGDLFELKKALPRFVVGVLIVPFSWWIVQFMISMASILMVSVFSWPMETFPDADPDLKKYLGKEISNWCDERTINLQGNFSTGSTTSGSGFINCSGKRGSGSLSTILNLEDGTGKQNIGGILTIYTFGIMDVESTTKVYESQLGAVKSLLNLSGKVIFDSIFILVYLVILIALFLALFIRFIMLWIYMMMSPLFGLNYFLQGKGKVGEQLNKMNFKSFLSLAMVPVFVAGALSFGLMFVFIMGTGFEKDDGSLKNQIFDFGSTKIKLTGELAGESAGIFKEGIGVIGYLMLKGFSLAVLWMAVMAALKASTITGEIIKPIEEFGTQVGKFAKQAPMYVPIPGTSGLGVGGKNATFGALTGGVSQGLQDKMNQSTGTSNVRNKLFGDEQSKQLSKDLGNAITLPAGEAFNKMKDIFRNNDEARLFLEKERVAEGMKHADIKGAEKIKEAKNKDELMKIMVDINNDRANAGKQIFGRNVKDAADAATITGSGNGTTSSSSEETKKEGDSKTPATFNINAINYGGVKQEEGKGLQITDKDMLAKALLDKGQVKNSDKVEDIIKKLVADFGREDKDKIILVVDKLVTDLNISDGKDNGQNKKIEDIFDKLYPETPPTTSEQTGGNP